MSVVATSDVVSAIERLTTLFRIERLVYLVITTLALLLLLGSAGILLARSQASAASLTVLFGSSGLITVSVARLLRMWERAFDMLDRATSSPGGDAQGVPNG